VKDLRELLRCVIVNRLGVPGQPFVHKGRLGDEEVVVCAAMFGRRIAEVCFVYEKPSGRNIEVKDIPGQPHASVFVVEGLPPPITNIFERHREELKRLKPEEALTLEI